MITEALSTGLGGAETVSLALRVGTGLFFAISGANKLLVPSRNAILCDTLRQNGFPLVPMLRRIIPLCEIAGGLALIAGFLTVPAASGLAILLFLACITDGRKRVAAMLPINRADRVDDWLYLSEVVYLGILAVIIATGPGPLSLDAVIFGGWLI